MSKSIPVTDGDGNVIGAVCAARADANGHMTYDIEIHDAKWATLLSQGTFDNLSVDREAAMAAHPAGKGPGAPSVSPRRALLMQAADLVDGDRNAQYGDPNQDFARTAELWNTYLAGLAERQGVGRVDLIEPQDVAWLMILLKASRSTVSPGKEDHYADVAGYAACGWHCVAPD